MQGVPEVVLRSEQTNAEIGMIRHTVPVGFTGPPLHRHDFDETFYVLGGQLTVQLGEDLFRVETGELAFAPRGFPHTFTNLADEPARYLIVFTPAGFERHFARMAAERHGVDPPDWALGPIPDVTRLGGPIDADRAAEARPIGV
jgi:quercetin dioxygenase-like cupin family protein